MTNIKSTNHVQSLQISDWCSFRYVLLLREGNSPDQHLTITYNQLLNEVCCCANVLKQMGRKLNSCL